MWRSKVRSLFNKTPEVSFNRLPNVFKERTKILKLLKTVPTPFFLADHEILEKRLKDLIAAFKTNWGNYKIAYSFKTNYEIAKLNLLKKNGLWAEVVSGREYQMAKKLGYQASEIIFNGPYKTESDLKTALNEGALIFIDNFEELRRIKKIAMSQKRKFYVGMRINSKIARLKKSRFGFSVDSNEAATALGIIQENSFLNLVGLHIHIGTDIDNPNRYQAAAKAMVNFIEKNFKNFENKIKILDFGGGFPSHGLASFGKIRWNPQPIESYIHTITEELNKIFKVNKPILILEPGRYLVDDAVLFITKIIARKECELNQVLTVDATMTMLPLVHYRPQIVKLYDKNLYEKKAFPVSSIVYGASCGENDILCKNRLPKAKVGDLLIYYVIGAYNQNMSSEFIFKKPRHFILNKLIHKKILFIN